MEVLQIGDTNTNYFDELKNIDFNKFFKTIKKIEYISQSR